MCSSIIGLSDSMEAFLSSCVPNLQSNIFLADHNFLLLEVDPHSGDVVLGKMIIDVLVDK